MSFTAHYCILLFTSYFLLCRAFFPWKFVMHSFSLILHEMEAHSYDANRKATSVLASSLRLTSPAQQCDAATGSSGIGDSTVLYCVCTEHNNTSFWKRAWGSTWHRWDLIAEWTGMWASFCEQPSAQCHICEETWTWFQTHRLCMTLHVWCAGGCPSWTIPGLRLSLPQRNKSPFLNGTDYWSLFLVQSGHAIIPLFFILRWNRYQLINLFVFWAYVSWLSMVMVVIPFPAIILIRSLDTIWIGNNHQTPTLPVILHVLQTIWYP